jgi:hypothetical protein
MATLSTRRCRGWLWLGLACVAIFAGIVTLATRPRSQPVIVTVGANGQARLYGLPLGRGVFRQAVFWGLFHGTKADVRLAVPSSVSLTNTIEILPAMSKAGWTNRQPAQPKPHE